MKLGFTGTRDGMTDAQRGALGVLLIFDVTPTEWFHGSCQGSDVEAARLVREARPGCRVVALPGPDGDEHREDSGVDDEVRPGKAHFARNRDIVSECDLLVATPCDMTEQRRGGTWMTVREARKRGKRVVIIWPDGSVLDRRA